MARFTFPHHLFYFLFFFWESFFSSFSLYFLIFFYFIFGYLSFLIYWYAHIAYSTCESRASIFFKFLKLREKSRLSFFFFVLLFERFTFVYWFSSVFYALRLCFPSSFSACSGFNPLSEENEPLHRHSLHIN